MSLKTFLGEILGNTLGLGGAPSGARLQIGQGTITAQEFLAQATTTWNNAAVAFTAFKLAITDTASLAGSLLLDVQVNGNPAFKIQKPATFQIGSGFHSGNVSIDAGSTNVLGLAVTRGKAALGDTTITGAAGSGSTLAVSGVQLTGARADSTIDITQTWNTTGAPTAIRMAITDTASAAGAAMLEMLYNGYTAVKITKAGNLLLGTDFAPGTLTVHCGTFNAVAFTITRGRASLMETTITGNTTTPGVNALTVNGVAQTGTRADSTISATQVWNTTGTPTAIKAAITDTASDPASLLLDLQVGAASRFKVAKTGAATAEAYLQTPSTIAYAATVTLDVAIKNDFQIDVLTGNVAISFSNPAAGRQGMILVKQDATGGRTVTFNAPATYTIIRDSGLADLAAASNPNAITQYAYAFWTIGGTNYLQILKSVLV